jgi:hypothetical protein
MPDGLPAWWTWLVFDLRIALLHVVIARHAHLLEGRIGRRKCLHRGVAADGFMRKMVTPS